MTGFRPPHLSASSIQCYVRCPALYRWRYIDKQPFVPSVPLLFGSAVHFGLAAWHQEEDFYRAFTTWWADAKRQLDEAGIFHPPVMESIGLKLLAAYDRDPLPWEGTPEHGWRLKLEGLPLLIGFFDLVSAPDNAQAGRLGEHKTAAFAWSPERASKEYQAALYSAVFEQVVGKPLESITYSILSYTPAPLLTRYTWLPSVEDRERAIVTAHVVTRELAAGNFEPRCPENQCDYPDQCGRPSSQAEASRRSTATLVTGG